MAHVPLSLILLLLLQAAATAQTYDAVAGWDAATNTTGNVWQYGTEVTLGGPLTLFAVHNANASAPTYNYWSPDGNFVGPVIGFNSSGSTINFGGSPNLLWPSNVLLMAPEGVNHGMIENAVLRWVAPTNGSVDVTGQFTDLQQSSVGLYIQADGSTIFNSIYSGSSPYQAAVPFSLSNVPVTQGEDIDFSVGTSGVDNNDAVGISATVTESVPEPTSLAILGVGSVILLHRRRA